MLGLNFDLGEDIDMLRDACDDAGVKWAFPCVVQHIERHATEVAKRYAVATDNGSFTCQSLVVATGGLAIPKIGATPFGYRLAEQFGIPVISPKPALVPLALAPELLEPMKPLAGATLDAVAQFEDAQFRENVLITHRGLSGPAILQISSYWQMQEYRRGKKQPALMPRNGWRSTGRAGCICPIYWLNTCHADLHMNGVPSKVVKSCSRGRSANSVGAIWR